MTDELKLKLKKAQSLEAVAGLLKEAGEDEAQAGAIWDELAGQKGTRELSEDEMDAVTGGSIDWVKDGCAAEVSIASWCWFKDWCKVTWVTYDNGPAMTCPKCFKYMYKSGKDDDYTYFTCKTCGAKYREAR